MSITAASVLTYVNDVLLRSETSIDLQLQTVLDDLSQGPYIAAVDSDQTLTDDDEYLDVPDDYYMMISVVLHDGTSWQRPLKKFPGGYKAYRDRRGDVGSVCVSHPEYYTVWGNYLWLWPTVGQAYTSRIDFYKVHSQGVDTIEFGDEFRRAINFGTTFEVAVKRKLPDAIKIWSARYQNERELMRLSHPGQPRVIGT